MNLVLITFCYRLSEHILNLSFLFCKTGVGRPGFHMSQKEDPSALSRHMLSASSADGREEAKATKLGLEAVVMTQSGRRLCLRANVHILVCQAGLPFPLILTVIPEEK